MIVKIGAKERIPTDLLIHEDMDALKGRECQARAVLVVDK